MYALTAGSDYILEIQLVGRLHGQTTRNVFHYHFEPTAEIADGAGFVSNVLATWHTGVGALIVSGLSNEWSIRELTGQVVDPVRYRKEFADVATLDPNEGQIVANSLPSAVCAVVSMYGDVADPTFQGRKYFGGIPASYEEDSRLNQDGMDWLSLAAVGCSNMLLVAQTTVRPTIAKTGAATALARQVTAAVPRDVLRIQRRREVGVGE